MQQPLFRTSTEGRMRIAVYGGSFNPPHVVHGQVASWLLASDFAGLLPVQVQTVQVQHIRQLAGGRPR